MATSPSPSPVSCIETSGARLAVYEEGTAGDTVVLLHGGPGVPDYLASVSAILAATHRVVRFDQRGTGRSPCDSDRYALDDYVNDLDAVRRARNIERLNLFGHSWGGLIAQLYAARHPDRVAKMCLCNSSIGLGEDWKAMERAVMAHNRRRSGLAGFTLLGIDQLLALLPGSLGDRAAQRMMARVWHNYFDPPETAPRPSEAWLAGIHSRPIFATRQAAIAASATDLPGTTTAPVLIVFGQDDIYGRTTERLIARYPNAKVAFIPRAGHVPWLQNVTAFIEEIGTFFKGPSTA